jgi:tyrosyl-tRNA synthetase
MSKGDGMSFAEFSYPLMQAWDWWHMFHGKGIQMQIGGSDQFGNITAGIAAIKYISSHHPNPVVREEAKSVGDPLGFTVPLLTTSSGQKFGKSAGNAIWLDNEETSTFELYGYFLRLSDEDVGKYLKMFTFMPLQEIDALLEEHRKSPSQRKAQHKLAREFVELVHGAHEAKETEIQHRLVFNNPSAVPPQAELDAARKANQITPNNRPNPNIKLPRSLIYQKSVGKVLFASGLAKSASEGHRLANTGGAYIGGPPHKKHEPMPDGYISWSSIQNWKPVTTREYLIHGDLLLLRRSKHNIRIIQVVSDQEYALSGEEYPGMEDWWRRGVLRAMAVKGSISKEEKEAVEEMLKKEETRRVLAGTAGGASPNPSLIETENAGVEGTVEEAAGLHDDPKRSVDGGTAS